MDIHELFQRAEREHRVGIARKTKPIEARPAIPGEVIVTYIAGEGEETRSCPAEAGDWVVRNRCAETGNEMYLVKGKNFALRYDGPLGPADGEGWRPFRPRGIDVRFFVVREADGSFVFIAPWGEPVIAKPGDAIVRNPAEPKETYRVADRAFACTYEIVEPPPSP